MPTSEQMELSSYLATKKGKMQGQEGSQAPPALALVFWLLLLPIVVVEGSDTDRIKWQTGGRFIENETRANENAE